MKASTVKRAGSPATSRHSHAGTRSSMQKINDLPEKPQKKTARRSFMGYSPLAVPLLLSSPITRYGDIDQLKSLVKRLHEVGIKALGDAVLNHRCAQHQYQNGVWNIFGGRLNWNDRAVVADDPHFQVRSSYKAGDFHLTFIHTIWLAGWLQLIFTYCSQSLLFLKFIIIN